MLRFVPFDPAIVPVVAPLSLDDRAVDVFAFSLAAAPDEVECWYSTLSCDERTRARSFARMADRDRYAVAHGVLRSLLATYCGVAAADLALARSAHGKPEIASTPTSITFNLSHCEDAALVAVGRHHPIGVDLERARLDVDVDAISEGNFSSAEREVIEKSGAARRADTFFRHWVAKEAVLKARGTGLSTPLDAFSVHFTADGRTAAIEAVDPAYDVGDYRVRMLPMPAGWHAALCAPADASVRLRTSYPVVDMHP
jgi:4'-phosphopantetheinyl transferase